MPVTTQDKESEQRYYDALFKRRGKFDQFQRAIYERIAQEARAGTAGLRALEIGCGSGVQALCLHEQGFAVAAMDLSREAVRVARATVNSATGRPIAVMIADAEHLPIADASIDACVCGLLLHHFADLDHVADEIARIVKPGGVVVAIDANGHNPFVWLFLNVVHRFGHLPHLTPNQRALRRGEITDAFARRGFENFRFASMTSELRRDWLGGSLAASLNFQARRFVLAVTRVVLPSISQGNMLLSVFRRPAEG